MNMAKVRKITPTSTALGNKTLISKVKDSMKRISEVNDMMAKRETRLVLCDIKYHMIFSCFKKNISSNASHTVLKLGLLR